MNIIANPIVRPFTFLLVSVILNHLLNLFAGGLLSLIVLLHCQDSIHRYHFLEGCVCMFAFSINHNIPLSDVTFRGISNY